MNIDNFLEQGLTFSEINILAKFEENGYDPENIYKMYKGFNLRELLEDVTKNNLKQEDISTFLNAKTFGNEEILKIVCDRTVKSDIKQPLLTLAGLSKNWKRFYTKESTKSQLKNIIKMIDAGIDEGYLFDVKVSKNDVEKYKFIKTIKSDFDLDSFIKRRVPISLIDKYCIAHIKHIDLDFYTRGKEFRPDQIDEIIRCIEKDEKACKEYGDIFFKEENDPTTMKKLLKLYEEGFPIEKLRKGKWTRGQLTVLKQIYILVKSKGINFDQFLNDKLKTTQLEKAYSALLRGFDYKYFLNEKFSEKRMRNILEVLAYNKLNPEDTLDINYYTNTMVPEHLLYEAIRGMQHTGHKLDTKLKFYKKFDEEIKRKEEMIKEKLEENIEK